MAFTSLDKILQHFLQKRSLAQISVASQITESWYKIAQELLPAPLHKEIAAISFHKNTLLLRAPSNLAAQEVQFKLPRILAAYKTLLGEDIVQHLRFRIMPMIAEGPKQIHRVRFRLKN